MSKFTGKKFSVEVKVCNAGTLGENDGRSRTVRQLSRALSKAAKYPRIVCIDLNRPATGDRGPQEAEQLIKREMRRIRENENNLKINGKPSPPAYVVLSNFPFRYNLQGSNYIRAALLEGIKIPGLNGEAVAFRSPRALSEFRAAHVDPSRFVKTLVTMQIPSTLDGEIPAKAFGGTDTASQLLVGERYLVKNAEGRDVAGELVQALVLEGEKNVVGLFRLEDGSTISCQMPITEAELKVYRESPDTFFGVYEPKPQPQDPGEWYEWFLSAYLKTPREGLLRLLADQADTETLGDYPQHELAKIYADRLACSVMAMQNPTVPQRLPESAEQKIGDALSHCR
jgi:hypothetical protein